MDEDRLGAADWLSLAAAPAFAVMAALTAAHGGEPMEILHSAAHHASPLGGMVSMYVLMSVVHSAPWLRLISRRRHHPEKGTDGSSPTAITCEIFRG